MIPPTSRAVGLGAMRLSTDPARDEARAIEVLRAALDAGVTLIDTANAYGLDEEDRGHNERLVARAIAEWGGDRRAITVVTKGGMSRPGGRWIPDGRARSIAASCEASLRALGEGAIDLYLLHAPDPRTPLATSVRALAELRRAGLARAIGLCNVTLAQIEEALAIAPIDAVEVALSPLVPATLRTGVVSWCAARNIRVIAHTPLGGTRRARGAGRDPVLRAIAARHGATAPEIALAWLHAVSPAVVAIPGATRADTARSAARAATIALSAEDLAELQAHVPAVRSLAGPPPKREGERAGEIVILMGVPAAGKSTLVTSYTERGYVRLNRDETGGRLAGLLPRLERAFAEGARRFVLDNTYATRATRAAVIEIAHRLDLAARCVLVDTSLEDAQINAAIRMIRRHGALLGPDEIRAAAKDDPNTFGPSVQMRYFRDREPPAEDEGFDALEIVPFTRAPDPRLTTRALVIELDRALWASKSGTKSPIDPDDVALLPGARDLCARHRDGGYRLFATAWRPAIDPARFEALFARARDLLGMEIELALCPHPDGPPACFCRKPLPGLGVLLMERHGVDPRASLHVGDGPADRLFAERLGFRWLDARSAGVAPLV
jgi:aryl-alcohol dehydrogenase-like predicted oxidoreductase/histidinol phosphatase-like enzyme/predicted kinase